jgi:hypothetical protein
MAISPRWKFVLGRILRICESTRTLLVEHVAHHHDMPRSVPYQLHRFIKARDNMQLIDIEFAKDNSY